jgi:hypothetical protein
LLLARKVPALVEVGPELNFGTVKCTTLTGEQSSDFIWAVRLAKITKNGLQKDWSIESVIGRESLLGRRATFSADPDKSIFNPKPVLVEEGLDDSEFEATLVDSMEEEYYITLRGGEAEEDGGKVEPGFAAFQCAEPVHKAVGTASIIV